MKIISFLALSLIVFNLASQNVTEDMWNGSDGCAKCYGGYISKNRPCDNCDGNGQINFEETCPICKGSPGQCPINDEKNRLMSEYKSWLKTECTGICHNCHGDKKVPKESGERKCSACKGSGYCSKCNGQGQVYQVSCKFCKGSRYCQNDGCNMGEIADFKDINCPDCNGTGKCLKRYPSNDNKCHGTGSITFKIQKNPKITQADKNDLAEYAAQQIKERGEYELQMKQKSKLNILKAKQEDAKNLSLTANQFFNQNKYNEALNYYNQSLNAFPDGIIEIKKQMVLIILDSIKLLDSYSFDYLDFPKTGIADFRKNYKTQILNYYVGPPTTCKVTLTCNGKGKLGLQLDGLSNQRLADTIIAKPFNYPQPAAKYGYYVNAKTTFDYQVETKTRAMSVTIKDGCRKINDQSVNLYQLKRILPDSTDGKYFFDVGTIAIDGITKEMAPQFKSYKSCGGPGTALLSLLVPGLGKSVITRSAKGLGTLILTGGLGVVGLVLKNKSEVNYSNYMISQSQIEMDSNYEKYKNNMIGMKLSLGTAAAIWLLDIYTVYQQGKYNKMKERRLNPSLTINQNQKSINLAIQIK